MPKGLRLKRTPAEEAERDLRKARKAAKKASLRQRGAQKADLDVKENNASPEAGPSTSRATGTVEDDAFDEKLWDALGDDDRLGAIEARLNEYGHVPRRWRSASSQEYDPNMAGPDDDPRLMDDDEYAEWVRVGMWRCVIPGVHF
jgi:hypothetical protein